MARYLEYLYEINANGPLKSFKLSLIFQETTLIYKRFVIITASIKH